MRAIKFSAEKMEFVMNTVIELIKDMENAEKRQGILTLMDFMGERYFEAPASHNLAYHNCCVMGLAEHSLRVYNNLRILSKSFGKDIKHDSMVVCGLFHDLGKLGSMDKPYYIEEDDDWRRNVRGDVYKHNPDLVDFLGGAQRSLRLLSQFNVPLSDDEYRAILIHDGQYIPENKPYAHKEGRLGLLLHMADMLACDEEKTKWESIQ